MDPRPDFGENTYKGHDKLKGKVSFQLMLLQQKSSTINQIDQHFAEQGYLRPPR